MTLRPSRRAIAAFTVLIVGAVATYNMVLPRDQRIGPNWFRGAFVLLGPVLLASGAVLAILSLTSRRRSGSARTTRGHTSTRWVLRAGLALLLIGGFPWAYTPLVCGFDDEEASGMMGTIIFLVVGLPGLAVTGIGVTLLMGHRRKNPDGLVPEGR